MRRNSVRVEYVMKIGYAGMPPVQRQQRGFYATLRQFGAKVSGVGRYKVQQAEDDIFEHKAESVEIASDAKAADATSKEEPRKPRRVHFPRLKNLRKWLFDEHRRGRVIALTGLVISLVGILTANPILSVIGTTIALTGVVHTAYFDWKAYKI